MVRAKFAELLEALDYVSAGQPTENEAYLSVERGTIHWHSEFGDNFETLPPDIDEPGKYIAIPHKNELGLGKRLVLQFAEEVIPADLAAVREIFSRRGAYARLKDLLMHRHVLERWYQYEEEAKAKALRDWCGESGIEIDE